MPKAFKYDVVQLIQGVRERPCLWDKSIENYKDRVERRTAWEEIFRILDETYENMTREDKRVTGELILNKWTNIRDTFVKSLRIKMGKPKKKYVLYDHLKFLIKFIPQDECTIEYLEEEDSYPSMKQENETEEPSSYTTRKKTKKIDYNEDYEPPKKSKKDCSNIPSKKSKSFEDTESDNGHDNINFVGVDEADPRIMNEDEAFFASLLPTVVKYNEDDRLEFRIQVLSVMKRIRDSNRCPVEGDAISDD